MNLIKRTAEFDTWMDSLKDRLTVIRLNRRLDKAQRGLLGDVKPVGGEVFEMREFFGSGFRMYYTDAWGHPDPDAGRRRQIHAIRRHQNSDYAVQNDQG